MPYGEALTSYFCLFSFSLRSNFSASSVISHCHSSPAFSLLNKNQEEFQREKQNSNQNCKNMSTLGYTNKTPASDCKTVKTVSSLQFVLAEMVDAERLPPLCQDLPLLLSFRLLLCSLLAILLDGIIKRMTVNKKERHHIYITNHVSNFGNAYILMWDD